MIMQGYFLLQDCNIQQLNLNNWVAVAYEENLYYFAHIVNKLKKVWVNF